MDPAKLPRVRMMWERGDDTLMHAYVNADMLRAFVLAVLAGEPAPAPAEPVEGRHTPGPWRVREGQGLWWTIEAELPSINGLRCWYTVARCDFDRAADGYTEGALNPTADARLIARAPELAAEIDRLRAEVAALSRERDEALTLRSAARLVYRHYAGGGIYDDAEDFSRQGAAHLGKLREALLSTPAPAQEDAGDARLAGLRHVKQIIEVDYIPDSSIRGYYTDLIEREIARLTAAPQEDR